MKESGKMSRSKRKTPKRGNCVCHSEKQDKTLANRKYRQAIKRAIKNNTEILPLKKEVSNIWRFGKDGKSYLKNPQRKDIQK